MLRFIAPVVSTHSRPKAAGIHYKGRPSLLAGFNTQPPEGGWSRALKDYGYTQQVSTHSRPKAAGAFQTHAVRLARVSTHSRPKAAGDKLDGADTYDVVSTHSRPKAAGGHTATRFRRLLCFNTQPPEGGWAP